MNRSEIIRSDDLRSQNRYRILSTLRDSGSLTRSKLGELTNLSQAALSNLLSIMIEEGLVTTIGSTSKTTKRGRPQSKVTLNPDAGAAVTLSINFNLLSVSLIDYAGNTLSRETKRLETRNMDEKRAAVAIINAIKQITEPLPPHYLQTISIGYQGITDLNTDALLWSPVVNFDNLPIAEILRKEFNVPVTVSNDCNLIAKALHKTERAKLGDSFATLLFSQGVGLGVYMSNQPLYGAHTSALEFGHLQFKEDGALCRCGKKGCIEAYAADYGIIRSANRDTINHIPKVSPTEAQIDKLIQLAHDNDKASIDGFVMAGKALGVGLATIFTLLDPIPVALVGKLSRASQFMQEEIYQTLKNAGHTGLNLANPFHCFEDDLTLQHKGLNLISMEKLDSTLADKEHYSYNLEPAQ
jgi:predicted NBD/HSP70 family sugar kinase